VVDIPHQLGPYLLFDRLGQGGMGDVFLARHQAGLGVERLVAVKTIVEAGTATQRERRINYFQREARIAATLTHSNIVHVYDAGKVDSMLYLAMEYIEGKPLGKLMARGPVSFDLAVFIGCQMLAGLEYLHQKCSLTGKPLGLVHRDISPQNVLLSYDGAVKLSDMGLAKSTMIDASDSEVISGKVAYMSPEQAYGLKVDSRSDLFSAAVVFYELLVGRRLYRTERDENKLKVLSAARRAAIPDPQSQRGDPPNAAG
jgi:serine/threonine protein kinase